MSWFPDVVVDMTGRVHAVWTSGTQDYDMVMYSSSQDGQTWQQPNDIAASRIKGGSAATRPSLIVDELGDLHMAYRDGQHVYYTRARATDAGLANAWHGQRVLSGQQVSYFSQVVLDDRKVLHFIYTENVPSFDCDNCFHVFYRQSHDDGATWSPAVDLGLPSTGAAKPQMLVDNKGNAYIVWESGRGGGQGQLGGITGISFVASHDSGATWASPTDLAGGKKNVSNPAISLDSQGRLLAVWLARGEDRVYYQLSSDQGRSWSQPQQVPNIWGAWTVYQGHNDTYDMATDGAGNPHLVLVGRTAADQTSLSVLHLVWNGSGWSSPETITTLTGDAPEWPRIAIAQGNQLHAVWFVRDQADLFISDNGRYTVWYAQGTGRAPHEEVRAWPTATPAPLAPLANTPDPAAAALALPKATPAPKLSPELARLPIKSVAYSENAVVLVLTRDLLPALALLVAAVVGLRVVRH
jgi:hypothetical protein